MKRTHAELDAEYRERLHIPAGEPLPNSLGQVAGHAHSPNARNSYVEMTAPKGVNFAAMDRATRGRRIAIAARSVPKGDIEAQLDEYAEAIERAELARDTARTHARRLSAATYAVRLRDRRDALMRSAGTQPVAV